MIPPTQNVVYDPSNNKADWTGMVDKRLLEKKHVPSDANQRQGIVHSKEGLVAAESCREPKGIQRKSSLLVPDINSDLIGGIAARDAWKTNNQRLFEQIPTERDQLIVSKRSLPLKPNARSGSLESTSIAAEIINTNVLKAERRGSGAVKIGNTRSMYANIGAALIDRV